MWNSIMDMEIMMRFALGDGFGEENIPSACRLKTPICYFFIGLSRHTTDVCGYKPIDL